VALSEWPVRKLKNENGFRPSDQWLEALSHGSGVSRRGVGQETQQAETAFMASTLLPKSAKEPRNKMRNRICSDIRRIDHRYTTSSRTLSGSGAFGGSWRLFWLPSWHPKCNDASSLWWEEIKAL
jgi:hypothetical protein